MKNILPTGPKERALALAIMEARTPEVLKPAFKKAHRAGCDPMTGYCSALTNAFFHMTGGFDGPYLPFQVGFRCERGRATAASDSHWFLVDTRKLPRGWQERGAQPAFRSLAHPERAVVDLTASQFDCAVPYGWASRKTMRQVAGGDVEPTFAGRAIITNVHRGLSTGKAVPDEIKRWARGTKVVDARGEPLLVWHGTTRKFDKFDTEFLSPTGAFGPGFYFTNDYALAQLYADGGAPIAAYLKIKKPFVIDYDTDSGASFRGMAGRLESLGYDGVLVKQGDYREVVALHPAQIQVVR